MSEPAAISIWFQDTAIEIQPDFTPELLLRVVKTLGRL